MAKRMYTLKDDSLFKLLFTKYEDLLKRLVADLLEIEYESIEKFEITNPEMYPENLGDKYCRLDINMIIDGQRVDLEVQVQDEGNFPERSLYYWARDFSTALREKQNYSLLPRTIVICIVAFPLFDCDEFHSEFQALEVTRHTQLTDKMSLHYYELAKLPELLDINNTQELWLKLFQANTEEEFNKIEATGVPVMVEAVTAYRRVRSSAEMKEIERMRSKAGHDQAQAEKYLRDLQDSVAKKEAEIAEKDTEIADKDTEIAEKDTEIAEKEAEIAEKDTEIAEKDALIAKLETQLRTHSNDA